MEAAKIRDNRERYPRVVAEAGFDIRKVAQELQEFYLSLV